LAQPQTTATQVMHVLNDALLRACPEKHLEYLSAGDLSDILAFDFGNLLSRASRLRLDQVADEKRACANTLAGLGCSNGAYIRAVERLKLLSKLTATMCALPETCGAPSDCRREH
jgi:hypothetical protein